MPFTILQSASGTRTDTPISFIRASLQSADAGCVYGVKVYQLDICEAIGDHDVCPGITTLKAGDFDLGTVACNCPCRKKPEDEQEN
jgi:hypothetical protein